jgi:hypothetical protein
MLHNIWKGLFMVQVDTIQAGNTVDTVVKTVKERSNMVKAREAIHLTQWEVARACLVDVRTVRGWENATHTPYLRHIGKLRDILKWTGTDAKLLEVFDMPVEETQDKEVAEPCHVQTNRGILESEDPAPFVIHIPGSVRGIREFMELFRRQFIDVLAKLGWAASFGNINLALVSSPAVEPQEYLTLCRASIGTWWQWLNQGDYHKVEEVLLENVPILKRLANTIAPFQGMAAGLAVEAVIMQAFLSSRKLDYGIREILCAEAVRFGALSGNRRIYTVALEWQGYTYTNSASGYLHPQRAISIFEQALSRLGSDALLSKANISIGLALAYAQDNTLENYETKAREYAELARKTMPPLPEFDPFYRCIELGQSELDQLEGQMYLHLADRSSNRSYAELARDLLEKSMNKQARNRSYRIGSLIKKADVARALGNMRDFVESLEQGLLIAQEIDSKRGMGEACDVMGRIPDKWQRETSVQNLRDELSHALIVARR